MKIEQHAHAEMPRVDPVLPREMAEKAAQVGVKKATMPVGEMFVLAVLAGAFVALGAVFSTVTVTGMGPDLPYGIIRLLAGLTFCLGLILVVVAGAELFTGNNLTVMAFASGNISAGQLLRSWLVVYAGNFAGAIATAGLMLLTGHEMQAGGAVGMQVLKIADAKCSIGFWQAVALGTFCNALVCLAVWLCYGARSITDKILAVVFPITAFVAAGFEHCVANMYFIPMGLLLKVSAKAEFWNASGAKASDFSALTGQQFLLGNLVPVTLGNVLGGSVMVGLVYWSVYLRNTAPSGD